MRLQTSTDVTAGLASPFVSAFGWGLFFWTRERDNLGQPRNRALIDILTEAPR